jgi:hypothetical protein
MLTERRYEARSLVGWSAMGSRAPRVDVVANGDVTSAYVWVNDPLNEPGAQRGISDVPPLAGDELWRYFVSSRFIVATFQGLWDSGAFPRYLDTDGNPAVIYNVDGSVRPDPDAAIRLDGFWLEFREPDTIVTNLWGVAQAAWPDVDFTVAIDDRFYPGPGDEGVKVIKTDSTVTQEADITLLNILAAIASLGGLALAGIVSGWFSGLVGLAIFFELEGLVAASRDPNLPVTPGTLLASRFPKSQAVGRGLKILFDYKRVRVDTYGVSAGAAIQPVPRASDTPGRMMLAT